MCFCWLHTCVFSRESSNTVSLLADPRVNPLTNGVLEISNVTHDDEGSYTCSVLNANLSISAELEVLSEWTHTHAHTLYALAADVSRTSCSLSQLCVFAFSSRQDSDPVTSAGSEGAAWRHNNLHLSGSCWPQTRLSSHPVEKERSKDLWVAQWRKVRLNSTH